MKENNVYKMVANFKNKYPMTVAWRIKSHAKVIELHLNPGEKVLYAFVGQKGSYFSDIFHTYAIAITDQRIMIAQKRLLFGYLFISITPDLFNDLSVGSGLIWGKIVIDTLNEEVVLTNIDKTALREIETEVSTYMMTAKQKYASLNREK